MIGNFRNSYRSGWNDMSFRGCSQTQFNYHDPLSHGWGFHHPDSRDVPCQNLRPNIPACQNFRPNIPAVAPLRQSQSLVYCETCEVKLPSKCMEQHKNGKRHRRLSEIYEKLMKQKTSNKQQSRQIPDSQMNTAGQSKKDLKSKKNRCPVENVSSKAAISKHKDYLKKDVAVTSEVPAEGPEGKHKDNSGAKGHGFKRKIGGATGGKNTKLNNGMKRPMESSKPDVNALSNSVEFIFQMPAITPLQGPVASPILAPTAVVGSSSELQVQHVSSAQLRPQMSKCKEHHEIQNPNMETNDQPQSISVELHAPAGSDICTQTEYMNSDSAVIAIAPPKGPMASQVFTSPPAVGLNFKPENQHALLTEVSKGKEHCDVQNHTLESNYQPQSISVELHVTAGSNINIQTENVNFDSAAIPIVPLEGSTASQVFAPPQAVRSCFEQQIEHFWHTEIEPQVSKAIAHYERKNSTDDTNIQLLPSILMEFDAPSGVHTNTQTADGSSKVETKMDVLTTKLEITQLSQVNVCLKCGSEGYSEALVFCNKCQVYALHRYCLDGPVILVDDVTWFCEDCEAKVVDTSSHDRCIDLPTGTNDSVNSAKDAFEARIELTNCLERLKENKRQQHNICEAKVVDTSSHDQCTLLSSGTSHSANSAKDASQVTTEITNCIERVKGIKQQQRNIATNTKVPLSDCPSLSHHGQSQYCNNCQDLKMSEKDCQPDPKGGANSSEGPVTVIDPLPIIDPIWRGSLCVRNRSLGTVAGLLAHLSTLACPKVVDETKLFPEVLCAELVQRSVVWPKCFMKSGPDYESIALYFFPENERVERIFDKLVDDIISDDLAIRAVVKNAELLIFPSTVLPIQFRRFQAKYYLWGVFKEKQNSCTQDK